MSLKNYDINYFIIQLYAIIEGVRTVTLDEDAQALETPLIKPIKPKNFSILRTDAPELKYEPAFMRVLMETPTLIRNIVILGQLRHGKTLFVDTLVFRSDYSIFLCIVFLPLTPGTVYPVRYNRNGWGFSWECYPAHSQRVLRIFEFKTGEYPHCV